MKKEDQQERLAEFFCILGDLRCVLANRKTTIMEKEAVLKEIENNWLSRFHWGAASGVYWLVGGLISRRQSDTAEEKDRMRFYESSCLLGASGRCIDWLES